MPLKITSKTSSKILKDEDSKPNLKNRFTNNIKTDPQLIRITSLTGRLAKSFPSASAKYLLDKFPIIKWLPNYSPHWILNDITAGTTIGLLLIPQSLAYARIANIPEEYGLMSSWLPPLIYALMGTSKGVLIAEIIRDFNNTSPVFSHQQIAGAITFLVGILGLLIGLLNLGFLLDFISAPVLSGFVSAAGILTILSQIPNLFGNSAGSGAAAQIHDAFSKLPEAKLWDTLIGFSCILALVLTEKVGKHWGKKYKVIWTISTCRNAILIMIFTIISYCVNKDRETPYFAISKISDAKIDRPSVPSTILIKKLIGRCITVFVAASLEHLAIAKTFSQLNGYKMDGSQELVFIGTSNLLNGFFPTIPGGGSLSRSAVNSESGVKTPLSGIVTSAFVLISIYFLTGALYWIPKATLSGVIICAVWSLLVSPSTFYQYWRISVPDFVASMISFWVALFVSIEMGIALAVAFNIIHITLRMVFSHITTIDADNWSRIYPESSTSLKELFNEPLPRNTLIFALKQPLIFLNAERTKSTILDSYYNNPISLPGKNISESKSVNLWSESSDDSSESTDLPRINNPSLSDNLSYSKIMVLDFSHVFYIDVTGVQVLTSIRHEICSHAGSDLQWRFVGMRPRLRSRLERASWKFQDIGAEDWDMSSFEKTGEDTRIPVFGDMHRAVMTGRRRYDVGSIGGHRHKKRKWFQEYQALRKCLDLRGIFI